MDLKTDGILAALAVVICLAAFFVEKHKIASDAKAEVTAQYQKQVEEQRKLVKTAEDKLVTQKLDADKEKANEIASVTATYQHQLDSLRKRKPRPVSSGSNPVAQAGESCTGAELYREDAEFLAGEAARADKVRIERDYYYQRYEDARLLLLQHGSEQTAGQQEPVSNAEPVSGAGVQP